MHIKLHCEAKKLHPCWFCNNVIKLRFSMSIFGKQSPEWICNSTCVQYAFLWLWHMHQGKLAISQLPDQWHFAGCQTTLQSEAALVHLRSVFNRFLINTFLQYSTYPVIHKIKVRTVRRPLVWSDEVWGGPRVAATVSHFTLSSATKSAITNLISWFWVFDFTKTVKQTSDGIFSCASICQKLS